jgi:hypothetical protein
MMMHLAEGRQRCLLFRQPTLSGGECAVRLVELFSQPLTFREGLVQLPVCRLISL